MTNDGGVLCHVIEDISDNRYVQLNQLIIKISSPPFEEK